jgi:hypothetical protein
MLCEDNDTANENYNGLDSDRDTEEAEVETAIRFFPEVLSRRKQINIEDDDDDEEQELVGGLYPIQCLSYSARRCNMKGIYFIPFVARVATELGLFEEQKRGGLLCVDNIDGPFNVFAMSHAY